MKRAMKWVRIGVAGLVGVVILAIAVVYALTSRRISRVYTFNDAPLVAPTDSASIARGRHFVEAIGKCAACHGDDLAGKVVFDNPVIGRLYAANLTGGTGGIGSVSENDSGGGCGDPGEARRPTRACSLSHDRFSIG